jgi:hypothetical protein
MLDCRASIAAPGRSGTGSAAAAQYNFRMSDAPRDLDRLPERVRAVVREFVLYLRQPAGDRVLGLSVFGAAAAGTIDLEEQVVHTALVLDIVDLDLLERLAAEGARWDERRVAAPTVFTPGYIARSRDTFPLEFIEIQQQHVTVFGEDHFAPLAFDSTHVRLQCERELKVLEIGLQQGILVSQGRSESLQLLGDDVAERLLRALRGALWLKGTRHALPAAQVVEVAQRIFDRPLVGISGAIAHSGPTPWRQVRQLHADVQALGKLIDVL